MPLSVSSPDISILDYSVLMDISGERPAITITNLSTQTNAGLLKWAFEIYSPGGIPIHRGTLTAPDRILFSAPFIKNTGFPRPLNSIEWSGSPYRVIVRVQDTAGVIFALEKPITVRPLAGYNPNNKNTYGAAKIKVTTRCRDAKLLIEDTTTYQHQGATGHKVSSVFELRYPPDQSGLSRPSFVAQQFNTALVPIAQSGSGFQYYFTSIVDYSLGDAVTLRVKYIQSKVFPIYCHIDLSPVIFSLLRLKDDAENGRCENREEAQLTINKVTTNLLLAAVAIMWPQDDGIDPSKLLDDINALTGWDCNCCGSGLTPLSEIGTDVEGRTYEIVSDGGDVSGSIEEIIGGIRIHVQDLSYSFVLCNTNTSDAFSITPTTEGNLKTYCLKVDRTLLTDEILTQFEANTIFINRLNTLIRSNLSTASVNVSTKCILPPSKTYSYTFTSPPITAGQNLLFSQITAGGAVKPINFLFDRTNPGAVTTALNNLGIGTFTVTFINNVLSIAIPGLSTEITSFLAQHSNASIPQELTISNRTVSDIGTYGVSTVMQALIDYVCFFTLSKIKNGQGFTVKDLSLVTGAVVTRDITSDSDLAALVQTMVAANNNIVDYIKNIKGVDCSSMRSLFPATTSAVADSTLLYGTDGVDCKSYDAVALAQKILKIAATNPDVKADFCAAQAACGKTICAAVTNADVTYNADAQTLTAVITNTGALRYRLSYRRQLLVGSVTGAGRAWKGTIEVDAASGVTTTQVFGALAPGTYEVQVIAVCPSGDAAAYIATSQSCPAPTSLSITQSGGSFIATVGGLPSNAEKYRIEISYPNGGTHAANYPTSQLTTNIPIPAGVYGTYGFVARSVCDESAEWYGLPSLPVSSTVATPESCPVVREALVSDLTTTSAIITVKKPLGASPNSYTLRYVMQGGGQQELTLNSAGDTVVFNLTGLTPGKIYDANVVSNCSNGSSSSAYNVGQFATAPNATPSSELKNVGSTAPTSVTMKINGVIVAGAGEMPAGSQINFKAANYTGGVLQLKVCDGAAIDAKVVSGGQTYNPSSANNGEFFFYNINIVSPIAVSFSNTDVA